MAVMLAVSVTVVIVLEQCKPCECQSHGTVVWMMLAVSVTVVIVLEQCKPC